MRVTVPSLAKLNLDLRVLGKRTDGFHELRTIFQTISLRDHLGIDFDFAKRTQIDVNSSVEIPDNLVIRSAQLVLDQLRVKARVRFSLLKKIPMGAGLGGGSSNAAAILIALPALAARPLPMPQLVRLAETLGSDVPFFLLGGTALGLGRGTELYPLPDQPSRAAVVVSSTVHVSTAEAYRSLRRDVASALTSPTESLMLREFQTVAWKLTSGDLNQIPLHNDFQEAVFEQHPELARTVRKLQRLGARPALMTGSGSAVFGIFADASHASSAALRFSSSTAFPVRFVSRRKYRHLWHQALGPAACASCFNNDIK